MARRSFPLWFTTDIIAFIGVIASYWSLIAMIFWQRQCARARNSNAMRQSEFDILAAMLAHAEGWLARTIARQARRANGLDPDTAPDTPISPPTNLEALKQRFRRYSADVIDIDAAASKAAQNLARSTAPIFPRLRGKYPEGGMGGGHKGLLMISPLAASPIRPFGPPSP